MSGRLRSSDAPVDHLFDHHWRRHPARSMRWIDSPLDISRKFEGPWPRPTAKRCAIPLVSPRPAERRPPGAPSAAPTERNSNISPQRPTALTRRPWQPSPARWSMRRSRSSVQSVARERCWVSLLYGSWSNSRGVFTGSTATEAGRDGPARLCRLRDQVVDLTSQVWKSGQKSDGARPPSLAGWWSPFPRIVIDEVGRQETIDRIDIVSAEDRSMNSRATALLSSNIAPPLRIGR